MKLSFIFLLLALLLVIGCEEMAVDPGTVPGTSSTDELSSSSNTDQPTPGEADSTWQEPGTIPGTIPSSSSSESEDSTSGETTDDKIPGTDSGCELIELNYEEDNGTSIPVKPCDSLVLSLEINGSTGYHWEDYSESEVQSWKSRHTICPETDLIGVSCTAVYSWKIGEIKAPMQISMGYEPPGGIELSMNPDGTISEFPEVEKFTLTVSPN